VSLAVDEDFEIPLKRPYIAFVLYIALLTAVALGGLFYSFPETAPVALLRVVGGLLLAAAVYFQLILLTLARIPRFSLRATRDGLLVPVPARLTVQPLRLKWSEVLAVRLSAQLAVEIETRARTHRLGSLWFRTINDARTAAQALDERLRREQQKLGAALAR
jgi:hypothetical protein